MVENYVDKYHVLKIQSQIGETFRGVLGQLERDKLDEFEKDKFRELHKIILLDDGMPRLVDKIKEIRWKMEENGVEQFKTENVAYTRQISSTKQSLKRQSNFSRRLSKKQIMNRPSEYINKSSINIEKFSYNETESKKHNLSQHSSSKKENSSQGAKNKSSVRSSAN